MRLIRSGTVIDPTVGLPENSFETGHNAVILAGSVIGEGARIGSGTVIERNVVIGPGCNIQSNCVISSGAVLGEGVFVGPGTIMLNDKWPHAGSPQTDSSSPEAPPTLEPVAVGGCATIGGGVVLMPGVRVGMGAMVGAGSLVNMDVLDGWLYYGRPGYYRHRPL